MKQKVKFSPYSLAVTGIVLIVFIAGAFTLRDNPNKLILFCAIFGVTTATGLYYCPKSIAVSGSGITLYRLLSKPKVFSFGDIQSVDTCYPSAGGIRMCGSGGFFGYWGYFNDIMIGTYFGYYGSRNHCIVIKLKSGKQYVVGCENPVAIARTAADKILQKQLS